MIRTQGDHENVSQLINSHGWQIFKESISEKIRRTYIDAKKSSNKDEVFTAIQQCKVLEEAIQLPYHLINESEYNNKDM
jgi:hypothetical protein